MKELVKLVFDWVKWDAKGLSAAIAAALLGGLMMGYGGIASTSLYGWLWIAFTLLGTGLGIKE